MDIHLSLIAALTLALAGLMGWVIYTDTTRYTISNRVNAIILCLFVVAAIFLPVQWEALGAAAIFFALGLGLFALGLMGGGDVKLLTVLTLWTGWDEATLSFFFLTGIFGGVLCIILLPLRRFLPNPLFKSNPTRPTPRILTRKEPVPYGIAIAMAFLWLLWVGGVPVLSVAG
jgi:prepilin peptidase CpaA